MDGADSVLGGLAMETTSHSDDVHQFSAQTSWGGVLGGNLADYTMIMSGTDLDVPVQSIKWEMR